MWMRTASDMQGWLGLQRHSIRLAKPTSFEPICVSNKAWNRTVVQPVLTPVDVFTPNDFPRHTYVNRAVSPPLEQQLKQALATPKEVISISGPSKSGKTVLIEEVVGFDNLITVSGSEIDSVTSLWDRVLDWMGAPSSETTSDAKASISGISSQIGGGGGIPLIAQATASVTTQSSDTGTNSVAATRGRQGLVQVQNEIAGSTFCVLVDDFHYIQTDLQIDIGRQIKTASERGIRIIAASVPHRSDDVVRSNSELRGRTLNIDTEFWTDGELEDIARKGFAALNVNIEEPMIKRLAQNACRSPQLMQRICLNVCNSLQVKQTYDIKRYVDENQIDLPNILATTSTSADFKTLVQTMHTGPKIRGQERNKFYFTDGSRGDVYRCILLAIKQDPPLMELPYSILMERIRSVCINDVPVGRSVTEACGQISSFASTDRTVEFDTDADVETFYISDPYWLFYLRCSPKLASLAKELHSLQAISFS